MKVLKFGGTSVQYSENMKQVLDIIRNYNDEKILVVLSACRGTTDNLIRLADSALNADSEATMNILQEICSHHYNLIENLGMDEEHKATAVGKVSSLLSDLRNIVEGITLLKELTLRTRSSVVAFGELLSTAVFSVYTQSQGMNSELADARKFMIIDHDGFHSTVDFEETELAIRVRIFPMFDAGTNVVITQGFIGSDAKGYTAVLSRGGSDYSAAVFAGALGADEIQIWTDVSGIFSADPRFYKNAKTIRNMTFAEVRELSFFGAKVLHPDTVKPAIDKSIPVRVLNTHCPEDYGTLLSNVPHTLAPYLSAAVFLKGLYSSEIVIPPDYKSGEFLAMLSRLVDAGSGKTYIVSANAGKVKIISDTELNTEFIGELETKVSSGIAVICLVGNNLVTNFSPELFSRVSNILSSFPIEYVTFSADESINIALDENIAEDLFKLLHELIVNF